MKVVNVTNLIIEEYKQLIIECTVSKKKKGTKLMPTTQIKWTFLVQLRGSSQTQLGDSGIINKYVN